VVRGNLIPTGVLKDIMLDKPVSVEVARNGGYSSFAVGPSENTAGQQPEGFQQAFMGSADAPPTAVELFGVTMSVANDSCLAQSLTAVM
jgi:hypothetical protein